MGKGPYALTEPSDLCSVQASSFCLAAAKLTG